MHACAWVENFYFHFESSILHVLPCMHTKDVLCMDCYAVSVEKYIILEVVTAFCGEICFTNMFCYFNLIVKE